MIKSLDGIVLAAADIAIYVPLQASLSQVELVELIHLLMANRSRPPTGTPLSTRTPDHTPYTHLRSFANPDRF